MLPRLAGLARAVLTLAAGAAAALARQFAVWTPIAALVDAMTGEDAAKWGQLEEVMEAIWKGKFRDNQCSFGVGHREERVGPH
jgi:hypothetical protein